MNMYRLLHQIGTEPSIPTGAILAGIVLLTCPPTVHSQITTGPDRLVDYVDPGWIATNNLPMATSRAPIPYASFSESAHYRHAPPRRPLTTAEHWQRFEAKFGIEERNPEPFLATLQSAKYNLDELVFSLQRFHDTFKDVVHFDHAVRDFSGASADRRAPRRYYSNPFADAMENAHFKSAVDMNSPAGRFFAGFKLELPIGD